MGGHESAAAQAAKEARFAIRAKMNHEAILYFIYAMAAMTGVFVFYHLLRLVAGKMKWSFHVPSPVVGVTR